MDTLNQQPDLAHAILATAPADDDTKASAWEVFHNTEGQEFEQRLATLSLPQTVKADLWEAKRNPERFVLTRPDIAAPPSVPAPSVDMSKDADSVVSPAGVQNPKLMEANATAPGLAQDTFVNRMGAGGMKAALRPVHTASALASRVIPGVQNIPFAQPDDLESHGAAESLGSFPIELAEWVAGEEIGKAAFEALGMSEKLEAVTKTVKMLQKHPQMTKILLERFTRVAGNAALGAATGALNTGTEKGAATGAASAGLTSGAIETAEAALSPVIKRIADSPIIARSESKLANIVRPFVRQKPLQALDVEATQPGGRQAISNVASDVNSKPVMGAGLPQRAENLGQRAEQIRAQSQPVYDRLDQFTQFDETKFSDLQKMEKRARAVRDFETADKMVTEQQRIADKAAEEGVIDADDYTRVRQNWRQSRALDKVDSTLNAKSVVKPTPANFQVAGQPDPGYIDGLAFRKAIQSLNRSTSKYPEGALTAAGLTPAHIQSLQDLGVLLENSGNVHKHYLLENAFKALKIAVGGPGTAGAGYGASLYLSKLMSDPQVTAGIVGVLHHMLPAIAASATHIFNPSTGEVTPLPPQQSQQ